MSRKSRRNTVKNAAKAERTPALRLSSTLGLSSLALGSVAFASALHAQDASPMKDASAGTTKAKAVPIAQQGKSLRSKVTRMASAATLPADGAGLIAQTSPAGTSAQNATVPAPTTSAEQLQEIVVTGIRGSLERALQIKKMSLGVVDAISAEDIGQFPDASLGAAIGRIPGVTVNRGSVNQMTSAGAPTATGNVTGISVRGFGTQFNEILSEGRQTASGNGQTFDYSALGANYVGEVDIHKTPDMSLSGGAIGATINVKFPNPFDNPGLHTQGFVSTTDYENDGGFRPAFGGLVSDTFADGKFGILADFDYTDDHIVGHHQDIVGWKGTYLPCDSLAGNSTTAFGSTGCALTGAAATAAETASAAAAKAAGTTAPANATSAVPSWYPQDMAMYLERTDSRRKDGRVSLQWHPNDNVLVTVDDNYSSDDEHQDRFQRSTWFGSFPDATLDANGTVTNFNYTGPTDYNSFVADTYIVTNTPGLNVLWDVNDDWTAELDAAQSVSKLNPNGTYSDVDADTGFGNATDNYTGGLALNQNGNVLPYWSAYGPNAVASGSSAVAAANYTGMNPFIIGSHVLPLQTQENSDKINQVKLDATWRRDSTKINFGAQFLDDDWNSKEMDTFTNNYWQLWSGYGAASGNTTGQQLPASLFTAVNISPWMPGYSGASNLPSAIVEYNPYAVLNYLLKQPINAGFTPSAGYPNYTGGIPQEVLSPSSYQHVDRKNYAPFVTAEQNFSIGDMTLKADLGLRYEKTDEDIAGLSALPSSLGLEAGDKTAYQVNLYPAAYTTASNSYGYFLPSLDLNLMVTSDLKLRADFSRTESAPNNSQIIPVVSNIGGRVNALTATGNNAGLLPYLADNYDLGAEWYYASNDYVSLDGFFKHVTQFPVSSVKTVTFPGVTDTSPLSTNFGNPAQFAETTIVNGGAANVTGLEATWQQMLMWGFGYQINGTYVHSNASFNPYVTTTNQFALPGIGNSANLIAFYERHGLQARLAVQWQGTQLLSLFGQEQSGGAFGNEPVNLASSTEVDFSTNYDITEHVTGYFEAFNLTDSVYHTYGRFKNQTLNLVDYGRSFTIGVRAKF